MGHAYRAGKRVSFVEDKFQRVYKQVCSFLPSFDVGVAKGCWRGVTSRHY